MRKAIDAPQPGHRAKLAETGRDGLIEGRLEAVLDAGASAGVLHPPTPASAGLWGVARIAPPLLYRHTARSGPIAASNLTVQMLPTSMRNVRAGKRAGHRWTSVAMFWICGCGSGGCQPPPGEVGYATVTATDAVEPTQGDPQDTAGSADSDDDAPLLPILNREALLARVEAQRDLLGADHLFEDAQGNPVPWLSPQSDLLADDEFDDDLLDSLPGSSGLGDPMAANANSVNGNALGLFEPLQGGTAEAPPLARFYAALRALETGADEDGKVRIAVYGASHTDADIYPQYLRTYLQERFGDGGHGFVHIAKPWRWYRHVDMAVEGLRRWRTEHAQFRGAREDGLFGLMGVSMATKSSRAWGKVTHRSGSVGSRYEIYYLEQPDGGRFDVFVDGKRQGRVKTAGPELAPGYFAFEVDEGAHEIEIKARGGGEIRLFGMTSERERPGVVVDTLGIGGTRASNMLRWDETVWFDNLQRRNPDLVILAYGTNEATDADQPIGAYEADLRAVVEKLQRAVPDASCMMVGPGDFPEVTSDGRLLPRPRVREIVEVQARVSAEMGCAFWDALAFMGGELSMAQWTTSVPQMAKDDYIHLTRRGYVRMGMALVDAMMMPFDGGDPSSVSATLASDAR